MVARVSPNCTRDEARRLISSIVNLHASMFASAVMVALSSHGFIISPLIFYYMTTVTLKCLTGIRKKYAVILKQNRR